MLSGKAFAQIAQPLVFVSSQRQVSAEADMWHEVAAAGSLTDPMRVVICAYRGVPVLTVDGGTHYPESFVEGPNMVVGDPFAVTVPASTPADVGRIYVGGISTAAPNRLDLTYHDEIAGTWSTNPIWAVVLHPSNGHPLADKPWLAVGPSKSDPQVPFYTMLYSSGQCSAVAGQNERLFQAYSNTTPGLWPMRDVLPRDPQTTGDPPNQVPASCHYRSWGILPHILDNGDIVAVLRDPPYLLGGLYNNGLPVFIWSDNGGQDWLPSQSQPVQLGANLTTAIRREINPQTQIGETPYYVDNSKNAPTIAIDRSTQPNTIYIAFAARHRHYGAGEDVIDGNSDIWIVRGRMNAAGTYVFLDNPEDGYFHLTDAMLGATPHADETGPDQWVPAIAIDCMGGINLTFYDNRVETVAPMVADDDIPAPGRMIDVYYARITGWPGTNPKVFKARLTPNSFPVGPSPSSVGLGNDYMTMATAGPNGRRVYPVYTARKKLGENSWSGTICYMHSVVVAGCTSDLNLNATSDPGDVELYLEDYGGEAAAADLTVDGLINSDDFDVFVEAYVSGE